MTPEIHWQAIALRLALTVAAGVVLGAERSRTGHAAGLRTTLLVTLAASVSMIQMNLLLPSSGKAPNSFAVMDVMRLPLGILTGVGFIGAGAIVRKNELVLGVTTAATMWFATVVGLCLGGGQILLGSVSTVIGFLVLWGLRAVESKVERYQIAELAITIAEPPPAASGADERLTAHQFRQWLRKARFHVKSLSVTHSVAEQRKSYQCELLWPAEQGAGEIPAVLAELERLPGVEELRWRSMGGGPN